MQLIIAAMINKHFYSLNLQLMEMFQQPLGTIDLRVKTKKRSPGLS